MYFYFHTSCTTWTQVILIHSHVFLLPHLMHYLDRSGTTPLTCISTSTPRALLGHKWYYSTHMYFYFHTSCTTWTQVVLLHSHVFLLPHLMHYLDRSGTSPLTCISTSTPRAPLGHKWYYSTHMYFYFHTSCTTWTQVVLLHSHVFRTPLEEVIRHQFLPALTGRRASLMKKEIFLPYRAGWVAWAYQTPLKWQANSM